MNGMGRWRVTAVVALAALHVPVMTALQAAPAAPPPVIAVVGEGGLNVLHDEFRLPAGSKPQFPAAMPALVRVDLPPGKDWAERMQRLRQGPLGNLKPGVLYWVAGTRLLVMTPDVNLTSILGGDSDTIVIDPAEPTTGGDQLAHGTGVVGAAIGRRTGTAPTAFALFVLGSGAASWRYVAESPWIDVATISHFALSAACDAVPAVRALRAAGRLPFTAVGNTQDTAAVAALLPTGLPEFFHVGGVDEQGRTRLVPQPNRPTAFYAAQGPQRPYDAGELFAFEGPDSTSVSGLTTFGGTSGASPRMAGRAVTLIQDARRLLSSTTSIGSGTYASTRSARRPRTGPLADGNFTADELEALLRATAVPAEPASPLRYEIEGYGAVSDQSMTTAAQVLRGAKAPPARAQDDAAHQRAEGARAAMAQRCR